MYLYYTLHIFILYNVVIIYLVCNMIYIMYYIVYYICVCACSVISDCLQPRVL